LILTSILVTIFWIMIGIVFYAYLGYGLLLWLIIKVKRLFVGKPKLKPDPNEWPEITFLVAAYNESDYLDRKVQNCLSLDYPRNKFTLAFVTDGSDDGSEVFLRNMDLPADLNLKVFHQDERQGKIAAVDRVMPCIKTPIVIFTDANTDLNNQALKNLARHFSDPKVGVVAGEKQIIQGDRTNASAAGEGIYWKYESLLKKWDSELNSVIGAAGELFAIRTSLYEPVEKDTLVEDFVMTMRIALKGYKLVYESEAIASETSSASALEELKRKVRISAGGLQALGRLSSLFNIFKYPILSFQYISHRVLRWTLAPAFLPFIFILNGMLINHHSVYLFLFLGQVLFYFMAFLGYQFEKKHLKIKIFFIPFYFCLMNYSVYAGLKRLLRKEQSVVWEKAKRADYVEL
jgi:poly-beta-1,6-N-acetyl-D-glucosamine synthase